MDVGRFPINVNLVQDAAPFRRALLAWYQKRGRGLPWRRTHDPYAIVVSEFMLQQTQVATVVPYYTAWLRRFPDFLSLAAANESDVLHAWQGLGYYRRARHLHATAKAIVARSDRSFPRAPDEMLKLPGLGRYTANAVATFAFDETVPVVEANIARCLARLSNLRMRIDSAEGQKALWRFAAALLPKANAGAYNSALMDLGALICIPGRPRCAARPVRKFCRAEDPAALPFKKPRAALRRLTESHHFTFENDRLLLEQSSDRWRGMWILPRLSHACEGEMLLHSSAFSFTHHRISLHVFASTRAACTSAQRWFARTEIDAIPMPSPHRRALVALLRN